MLNALRRGAKGVLAKVLIGLLVISFAIWGISDFVNQIDPTEVARAGETPVSSAEFERVYRRVANRTSQQMGTGLTPEMADAIGLPNQVLQTLVTEALQVDAARDLGVDLGDDALAERIREDPTFAGPSGDFDRALFDAILRDNRYSEAEYVALQREAAIQELWVNALVGGVAAPEPYLEAFNRYANQTRQADWLALNEDDIGPIEDPTDGELRAYFDDNIEDFRAPQYRAVSLVTLDEAALADPASVAEEDVRAAYEIAGAYGTPERRRVQQVILDDPALAEKAAAAIADGAAFSAILTELDRSLADVDLGLVTRGELVDPAVAEAAFDLAEREAAAVDGRFGPTLVRVSEIVESEKRPFEEVEEEIRTELAREAAADEVDALYDDVEDAVAGGARVEEVAQRFSLPHTTVEAVDAEGLDPSGEPTALADAPGVREAAFAAEVGDDATPVRTDTSTVWVAVDGVTEAADRAFEDVRGEVLAAWTEARKAELVAERAEAAHTAIEDGASVEEVAQQYGVEARATEPFSRAEPPEGLPEPAVVAAFDGPVGHTAEVATGELSRVVLKVTEVSEPAFFEEAADLQPIRSQLSDGMANAALYDLINAWQAEVGATVNRPVLEQIVGLSERGQR